MTSLRGVRVFDGSTFPDGAFDVELIGDRIARIEPSDALPQRTLLPGVVDCHVHLGFADPAELVHRGVTTVLDLGWPLAEVRRTARETPLTVRYAGPILTAPGGYPTRAAWAPRGTGEAIADPDDARTIVGRLAAAGVSVIKIAQEPRQGPVLDDATLTAIVDAAHAAALQVVSHIGSAGELSRALDAGVDILAHGLWSDEPLPDGFVERFTARGGAVIPTMRIDPSPARRAHLAAFVAAGTQLLYGTDLGNPPTEPGIDPLELEYLCAAGSPVERVLAAATSVPCDRFGWNDRGRIAVGLRADLVLVDGDPRSELGTLARPAAVWIAGEEQP